MKNVNGNSKEVLDKVARIGYAAKGIVYGLIGILAVQTALGLGGETSDAKGVLKEVSQAPFGMILLALIALGLASYVVWRIIESLLDPGDKGTSLKGIAIRIGYFGSGIIYSSIVFAAIKILIGSSSGGGGQEKQQAAATVMSQPYGKWLIILGGCFGIGAGLYQLYKGVKKKFLKHFSKGELGSKEMNILVFSGIAGLCSRFVVFTIIGIFLINAGINHNPQQAGGIEQAMIEILNKPFGPIMLGVVAAGVFCYGIFMFFTAKYRNF